MSRTSRKRKTVASPDGESRRAIWNQAISTIAGGFAHDANNCLTGIFSMSDLCLTQVDPQNPLHESLSLMRDSASQASQLLQRLAKLIYDLPGTRTYHDLNEVAADTADILRRVLPRSIHLRVDLNGGPLPVFIDAVELRQVLICLALGAARQEVSTIVIATAADAKAPGQGDPPSAPLVMVEVSHAGSSPNMKGSAETPANGSNSAPHFSLAQAFADAHEGLLADANSDAMAAVRLYLPRAELA